MTRPRLFDRHDLHRPGGRLRLASGLIAAALVLASCGTNSSDDRQFANEPVTREATPETPTSTTSSAPTSTSVPLASPETLLRTRGAPDTLYTVASGQLVSVTLGHKGTDIRPIALPARQELIDFDGSPNGDRVAVITGDGNGVSLLLFDRSGKQLQDPIALSNTRSGTPIASPEIATPAAGAERAYGSVIWSPQGRAVLVVGAAGVVNVPIGGEPEAIDLSGVRGTVRSAAWSPQGSQLALLTVQLNGSQRVVLLDREGQGREIAPLEVNPGMSIEHLQWLPDGSGMLFVRAPLINGVPMNGQLFMYRFKDPLPTLVATSGQGGPSASITAVTPSPDGRSVAYVISIRDGDHWSFHSLWVRSFRQPLAYEVPVDDAAAVSTVWWIDRGLAWDEMVRLDETSPREIVFLSDTRGPTVLLQATPTANGATPIASPVASPVATPLASPGATPVGTPIATPMSSPGATPAT
jgi:hypothetical protein